MAALSDYEITQQADSIYLVTVPSHDGPTTIGLLLADAVEVSAGRLSDSAATAKATIDFLLTHQDAVDLPWQVEIGAVLAAYPDALAEIESRLGNA